MTRSYVSGWETSAGPQQLTTRRFYLNPWPAENVGQVSPGMQSSEALNGLKICLFELFFK